MLRTAKPRTAAGKRALKDKAPKVVEDVKSAVFIRGSTTNEITNIALHELLALKKPHGVMFSRKNDIHPFDDPQKIEFFAQKNDASLFVIGAHTKKRPHNLTLVRTFNYQVLDMIELGLQGFEPMFEIPGPKASIGNRPLMVFQGELFETDPSYQQIRSMLLDIFRGEVSEQIDLKGIEHTIVVTAAPDGLLYFRVYMIDLRKSGTKLPRVELHEMGPSFDFVVRRTRFAPDDIRKEAMKVPKETKVKKVKNVEYDPIGDKLGRVHVGKQDLAKLQTRKMKGLKRTGADEDDADVGTGADGDEPRGKRSKN
ncbi:Brix domain-containing protein [Polychytrium aggregatum]|uniref:Brix domain-containing protein n=1 Tax=Polychytrium aggregatum TaxID=110093 RepID=UPI0022FF25BE|nr:Brix domain-containing protein [Polychytrium aggregatum]KAI9204972.1 Brix domain-containing protein [Polychytrium aggregatum]